MQVGSALAYRSIPLQSAYCAAKHAIEGFTQSVRSELLHDGSKVWITMVQMPALNTPQFDWVKSRLPRKAQPMGKVFQPEVAAEALVYAAHHRRREIYVGWPTVEAIVGNKIMPGYGDHYLARVGYDGQQYDGPADPNHPNNLWEPVDQHKDYGAHGDFDREAHSHSLQLWTDLHRDWLLLAGVGIAGGIVRQLAVEGIRPRGRRSASLCRPPNKAHRAGSWQVDSCNVEITFLERRMPRPMGSFPHAERLPKPGNSLNRTNSAACPAFLV